jgi:phosphatidylserine/phosphatidylglycerophosphate/cardiolipin synthase-like enzyme
MTSNGCISLILNGRFPMSIKKMFILIMVALVPSISFGMDVESSPTSKRAKVVSELEGLEEADLSFDEDFYFWRRDLEAYIGNFDVAGVRSQLTSDEVQKLSDQQRESLVIAAVQRSNAISKQWRSAQQVMEGITNETVLDTFTPLGEYSRQAKQIQNLLFALKLMKKFKFPQAHFTPRPYMINASRPSLDSILETLIMNEQRGISVCCFHLTLYNIAQHLVDQKRAGVHIEVVTDQKQGKTAPLQGLNLVVDNGIELMAPKNDLYEMNHHKFFIFISNVLNKPLICTGSYNPTGYSNVNSWDDMNIIDDPEFIQSYRDRFAEIKAASKLITQDDLAKMRTNPSQQTLDDNKVPDEEKK